MQLKSNIFSSIMSIFELDKKQSRLYSRNPSNRAALIEY